MKIAMKSIERIAMQAWLQGLDQKQKLQVVRGIMEGKLPSQVRCPYCNYLFGDCRCEARKHRWVAKYIRDVSILVAAQRGMERWADGVNRRARMLSLARSHM